MHVSISVFVYLLDTFKFIDQLSSCKINIAWLTNSSNVEMLYTFTITNIITKSVLLFFLSYKPTHVVKPIAYFEGNLHSLSFNFQISQPCPNISHCTKWPCQT